METTAAIIETLKTYTDNIETSTNRGDQAGREKWIAKRLRVVEHGLQVGIPAEDMMAITHREG